MKYLTKSEVAEKLRVTVRTISSYNKSGLLPLPRQLGRRLLWLESEVDTFLSAPRRMIVDTAVVKKRAGRPRTVIL